MLTLKETAEISTTYNTILSCNCQSLNHNKHSKLKTLVDDIKFPLAVVLQEVWHPKIATSIPNYQKPIQNLRGKGRGGGLSTYVRTDIVFTEHLGINELETIDVEKLAVIIENPKKFILINLYRPPKSNQNNSIREIETIIETATHSMLPFVILGDINFDLLTNNHISNKYTDMLQTYNLSLIHI